MGRTRLTPRAPTVKKKTPRRVKSPGRRIAGTNSEVLQARFCRQSDTGASPKASLFRWRSRQSCEKYGRLLTAAAQEDSATTSSRAPLTPCAPHRDVVATTVSLKPLRRLLSRTGKAEYRARAFREDRGREASQATAYITGKRGLLCIGEGK